MGTYKYRVVEHDRITYFTNRESAAQYAKSHKQSSFQYYKFEGGNSWHNGEVA